MLILTNRIKSIPVKISNINDVKTVKGKEAIESSYAPYLIDESKMSGGNANYLFFPRNEGEVVAVIKFLYENDIPVTIQGGRTGIVGSAIPLEGAIIAFDEMKEILGLGYDEKAGKWFVRLQPGLTLDELKDILKYKRFEDMPSMPEEKDWVKIFKESKEKYYYPVDPTEMSAMIGGTIAANASGARTFKYGATREWVKRLKVVLATGDVLEIERGQYFEEDGCFIIETRIHYPHVITGNYKLSIVG